jgi:uncharacterized membrane protein
MYSSLEKTFARDFKFAGQPIGKIVSESLGYVFAIAGFMLLIYLILGGFGYMTSAGDPKKAQEAKSKITSALIGFLIVFIAYWLTRLIGLVFGVTGISDIFK